VRRLWTAGYGTAAPLIERGIPGARSFGFFQQREALKDLKSMDCGS